MIYWKYCTSSKACEIYRSCSLANKLLWKFINLGTCQKAITYVDLQMIILRKLPFSSCFT